MTKKGYNNNGRIEARVSQQGGPWTGPVYTIRMGDKDPETGLYSREVENRLTSQPYKPSLLFAKNVCGDAKKCFRSRISNMPLPQGAQM